MALGGVGVALGGVGVALGGVGVALGIGVALGWVGMLCVSSVNYPLLLLCDHHLEVKPYIPS